MSKIIQIKVFNDILDQFFEYLQTHFTFYRSDIILAKTTIGFLQRNNPRLVVEQFMDHINPYTDYIFNCDEQFFLNFQKSMSDDDFVKKNIFNIYFNFLLFRSEIIKVSSLPVCPATDVFSCARLIK